MKWLHLLTLNLCLFGLLLYLGDAEAYAENCEETHLGWWSEAEKHIWNQICAGEIADFNTDKENNLELSCSLAPNRRVSWRFLKTIISKRPLREAITQKGVRITGACFPHRIELQNAHLPWPLELKNSRFENGLNMFSLRADRSILVENSLIKGSIEDESHRDLTSISLKRAMVGGFVSFEGTEVEGKLDMTSVSIGRSLFLRRGGIFSGGIALIEAKIGGQLSMTKATVTGMVNMASILIGSDLLMAHLRVYRGNTGADTSNDFSLLEAEVGGVLSLDNVVIENKLQMASVSVGSHLHMRGATFKDEVDLRFATVGLGLNIAGGNFGRLDLTGATVERELRLTNMDYGTVEWYPPESQWRYPGQCACVVLLPFNDVSRGNSRNCRNQTHDSGVKGSPCESDQIKLDLRNTKIDKLIATLASWPKQKRVELEGFTYHQLDGLGQEGESETHQQSVSELVEWLGRNRTFSLQPYHQLASVLRNAGRPFDADRVLFAGKRNERQNINCPTPTYLWLSVLRHGFGYGVGVYTFYVLRNLGPFFNLDKVLFIGKDHRRLDIRDTRCLRYAWLSVLHYGIGYGIGIYTFCVLKVALMVTLFGWLVLYHSGEDRRHEETVGRIGFWFSLDYLLPVIRLRQAHFDSVDLSSDVRVYFYFHQIIGYILVFFVIAGLTGITQW